MLDSPTALLVEDHASFDFHFEKVFTAERFTAIRSVEDLLAHPGPSHPWNYAFIDFALAGTLTGFTALAHLRRTSPRTRCIVFTALGEGGRTLYAVAASRWLGAWAIVDKQVDTATLRAVRSGTNPTPPGWTTNLHLHGHLLDQLFPEPTSLQIWRKWREAGGTSRGFQHVAPKLVTPARRFAERAPGDVRNFQAAFLGGSREPLVGRKTRDAQLVVTPFIERHSIFFDAPDLDVAVRAGRLWEHIT